MLGGIALEGTALPRHAPFRHILFAATPARPCPPRPSAAIRGRAACPTAPAGRWHAGAVGAGNAVAAAAPGAFPCRSPASAPRCAGWCRAPPCWTTPPRCLAWASTPGRSCCARLPGGAPWRLPHRVRFSFPWRCLCRRPRWSRCLPAIPWPRSGGRWSMGSANCVPWQPKCMPKARARTTSPPPSASSTSWRCRRSCPPSMRRTRGCASSMPTPASRTTGAWFRTTAASAPWSGAASWRMRRPADGGSCSTTPPTISRWTCMSRDCPASRGAVAPWCT